MPVITRPAERAVVIQPFRQAQGPEPVEGLDCFVSPLRGPPRNDIFKTRRSLPVLRLALALGALALVFPAVAPAALRPGDPFPRLDPAALDGRLPEIAGKVVLVDFWASWCAPCRSSFPHYARLHTEYAERGLVIVAVSVDEDAAAYAAFVRKYAPPFAVVRDKAHALVETVGVPAMPTCFVLDREGRVRAVIAGYRGEETERELRRVIEETLSLPSP